jgi:hypothetical protein
MKLKLSILTTAIALCLPACMTAARRPDPLKSLAIDECADARRSSSEFNAQKNYQLLRLECEQILILDEGWQKIENVRFQKHRRMTYLDEQEQFDDEAWFLITERIREEYYPGYLSPKDEIARADLLNERQNKMTGDESIRREYTPRLLPASPYLMSHKELGWASEAADRLYHEHKGNKRLHRKLAIISVIITKERQKKDPFLNRY